MKKLLLLAAAALISSSALATTWAVVGSYTNPDWNFAASTQLTGEGDNLSCTIAHLTSDFKIVDIDDSSWAIQYGTATPLQINTPVVLTGKNGGPDPANIKFAGLIQAVNNATVKWNPSTYTLEVVATEADLEIGYPTLYATGSFCNWNAPGEGNSVLCTESNGVYTVKINLGTSGNVEFKLAGAGWSNEIAGGVTVTDDAAVAVTLGGGNLKTTLTGEQTLTFNYQTMSMTFGDPALTNTKPAEPEKTWALVGAYTTPDWNFDASAKFTGEGDNLSCTVDKLIGDFKIVDITNNNWDTAYGYGSTVEVGQTYTLVLDGDNIKFPISLLSVSNAKVNWNPSTAAFSIEAAEADIETGYPTLYVTGNFNNLNWPAPGDEGSVLCTREGDVYTAKVNLGEGDDEGKTEFKLAGAGWSNQIAGGVEVTAEPTAVTAGGDNLYTYLTGEQTLYFNINTMKMAFSNTVSVAAVETAEDAPAVYYNLQGMKVENPSNGIFIVKKGNVTTKTVIR